MWFEREISEKIRLATQKFPVVVLTGARQVGKTALLKKMFPSYTYVSLDVPSTAANAERDPARFFAEFKAPALIDEVQYAPMLFRHLKSVVDSRREQMGQFILTGSQKFTLMKEVSESLAGRAAILELETLSAKELTSQRPEPFTAAGYADLVVRGGFPALRRDPEMPLDLFFSSYLSTYLERDVRQLLNVASLRNFERFIRACAARNAQTVHKSALAGDVGVSATTIGEWLGVLEASNQIVFLEPWFANFGKRIVKAPKLYFADTGLLCYLLGIGVKDFSNSPFVGAVWESYVFSELRKLLARSNRPRTLWFYRDKQQLEVDFMMMGGGTCQLLECKWTEFPDKADGKNILRLLSVFEEHPTSETQQSLGIIVSRTEQSFPLSDQIRVMNIFGMSDDAFS